MHTKEVIESKKHTTKSSTHIVYIFVLFHLVSCNSQSFSKEYLWFWEEKENQQEITRTHNDQMMENVQCETDLFPQLFFFSSLIRSFARSQSLSVYFFQAFHFNMVCFIFPSSLICCIVSVRDGCVFSLILDHHSRCVDHRFLNSESETRQS